MFTPVCDPPQGRMKMDLRFPSGFEVLMRAVELEVLSSLKTGVIALATLWDFALAVICGMFVE